METRKHHHEVLLPCKPERTFALLHTPSAIRQWWGAARAIVLAWPGGLWVASWGEHEDDPDYISAARIAWFEPPRRLVLAEFAYFARSGPLPFDCSRLSTEFTVEPRPGGSRLRVVQDGFPSDSSADAFYGACERGWRDTFEEIKRYVNSTRAAAG